MINYILGRLNNGTEPEDLLPEFEKSVTTAYEQYVATNNPCNKMRESLATLLATLLDRCTDNKDEITGFIESEITDEVIMREIVRRIILTRYNRYIGEKEGVNLNADTKIPKSKPKKNDEIIGRRTIKKTVNGETVLDKTIDLTAEDIANLGIGKTIIDKEVEENSKKRLEEYGKMFTKKDKNTTDNAENANVNKTSKLAMDKIAKDKELERVSKELINKYEKMFGNIDVDELTNDYKLILKFMNDLF